MSPAAQRPTWSVPPALDDELYDQAVQLAQQFAVGIDAAQWSSLLSYAQRWGDVQGFVQRQGKRDWQGNKRHYKEFYDTLQKRLTALEKRARQELAPNLSTNEARQQFVPIAGPLAQAFLQHLCAEALLKRAVSGDNERMINRTNV